MLCRINLEQVDVPVFKMGTEVNPVEIARQGLIEAKKKNVDVVIMDTAGRLQVQCLSFRKVGYWQVIFVIYLQYISSWFLLFSSHHQIDKAMMDELKEVKRELNPTEVLLIVDAMTGQEAAGIYISPSLKNAFFFLFLAYWITLP